MRISRSGRLLGAASFAVAAALAVAPAASGHRLSAQGAAKVCNDAELCFDTHLEGHYTDSHVPGVDPDYSFFDTSVDSDDGHSSIDAGWRWLEGMTEPHYNTMSANIEENVDLVRIAPGPIMVRATLLFGGAAQITGNAAVGINGTLAFNGCQVYVTQEFTSTVVEDPQLSGSCGAESTGAELVVTQTYDEQPPTHPLLRTQLQSLYVSAHKGDTIAVQAASDLHFEVWNATTYWDTPTFLTEAPEPGETRLATTALAALAFLGRRSARPTHSVRQAR